MGEIQGHEQVSSFTDLVSFLKKQVRLKRLIPRPAGETNPKQLGVELTLKYIRMMLYNVPEEVPRIEGNLGNLLNDGTLSWTHFKSLPCPLISNLALDNLDRFCRLILSFKFTKIHVDFLKTHNVDFFESEQFQSQVLAGLLTENYEKGMKEDERIVEEFLKLNKNSTAAQKYNKTSLLHLPSSDEDFIPKYISVARRAVQLVKGWKLTTIQILSSPDGRKGQFFKVSTGSGKSAIIAIVVAGKVLLNKL